MFLNVALCATCIVLVAACLSGHCTYVTQTLLIKYVLFCAKIGVHSLLNCFMLTGQQYFLHCSKPIHSSSNFTHIMAEKSELLSCS